MRKVRIDKERKTHHKATNPPNKAEINKKNTMMDPTKMKIEIKISKLFMRTKAVRRNKLLDAALETELKRSIDLRH